METVETPALRASGKLRRQRSRLQMQAPSSIQVGPASRDASEWRVAIPLLSPLDISPIPAIEDPAAAVAPTEDDAPLEADRMEGEEGGSRWRAWQHPAAPFYYEPVPGSAPAFVHPHCS